MLNFSVFFILFAFLFFASRSFSNPSEIIRCGKVLAFPPFTSLTEEYELGDIEREITRLTQQFPNLNRSSAGESEGIVYEEHPSAWFHYVNFREIGKRDIPMLELFPRIEKRGQLFIVSGHHATEPAGPLAALRILEGILQATSPRAVKLKDFFQITIIPIVDVDQFSLPFAARTYSMLNNGYHQLTRNKPWNEEGKIWGIQSKTLSGALSETQHVAQAVRDRIVPNSTFLFDLHEAAQPKTFNRAEGFFLIRRWPTDPLDSLIDAAQNRVKLEGLPIDNYRDNSTKNLVAFALGLGITAFTQESPRFGETSDDEILSIRMRQEMHALSVDEILDGILKGFDP